MFILISALELMVLTEDRAHSGKVKDGLGHTVF